MSDATFEGKIQQPKLKGRALFIRGMSSKTYTYYIVDIGLNFQENVRETFEGTSILTDLQSVALACFQGLIRSFLGNSTG